MAQLVEVKVPDIGDFKDVAVIEVMVKPGETIAVDTGLVMVESDKASMEIPSSHAGVVKELKVKVNDKVSEGSVILTLEAAAAGKPAVSTRAGGVADVVNRETGILVARGDHEALGAAIAELATDAARRQAMGTTARNHVLDRFSNTRIVGDIDALYRELLEASRAKVGRGGRPVAAGQQHMDIA